MNPKKRLAVELFELFNPLHRSGKLLEVSEWSGSPQFLKFNNFYNSNLFITSHDILPISNRSRAFLVRGGSLFFEFDRLSRDHALPKLLWLRLD